MPERGTLGEGTYEKGLDRSGLEDRDRSIQPNVFILLQVLV